MCGIFGIVTNGSDAINNIKLEKIVTALLKLSETRGKEASGVCYVNNTDMLVLKRNIRASLLVKSKEYREILGSVNSEFPGFILGHARMVTNGDSADAGNNQPVIKNGMVCVHNGIITNDSDIWKNHEEFVRNYEVDTEALLELLENYDFCNKPIAALKKALDEIEGSVSIAITNSKNDSLVLYTNVGSLYLVTSISGNTVLFSSEKFILSETIKTQKLEGLFDVKSIVKLPTDECALIDYSVAKVNYLRLDENINIDYSIATNRQRRIVEKFVSNKIEKKIQFSSGRQRQIEKLLDFDRSGIHDLKRCTKCLLPETFPGIEFDDEGVCSICNQYVYIPKKDKAEFEKIVRSHAEKDYDCIVPLSGGRDSCYMLHYMVKEMGLRVVAYTYDWGMVTDLARRNIQRMCSALHVEHVLISADIKKKRENVRLNVNAWLKKPSLATIPLFMAGDKQFFYYAQLLKRQMNVNSIVFGMNSLEETKFKSGFAGIKKFGKDGIYYDFENLDKIKLALKYGSEFLKNTSYLNKSLLDSFGGYVSYYLIPKDFIQFFDYYDWKEKTIEDTIINKYNWETASNCKETWRIGDGTAPFYNYIYYKLAGFTEFDTFKSNQIREGTLPREVGLASLNECNTVSAEGFAWYCDTIGIDPIEAIKIINKQKTLYN